MSKGLSRFYRLVGIVGLSLILTFIIQHRFTGVRSMENPALILEGIDTNLVFFDNNLYFVFIFGTRRQYSVHIDKS